MNLSISRNGQLTCPFHELDNSLVHFMKMDNFVVHFVTWVVTKTPPCHVHCITNHQHVSFFPKYFGYYVTYKYVAYIIRNDILRSFCLTFPVLLFAILYCILWQVFRCCLPLVSLYLPMGNFLLSLAITYLYIFKYL